MPSVPQWRYTGTIERTTSHQPTMRPPSSATNCGLPVRMLRATNPAVSSIGNGSVCASQARSAMTAAVHDANPAMSAWSNSVAGSPAACVSAMVLRSCFSGIP